MIQEIKKHIEEHLKEKGVENPRVLFDHPSNIRFGDYSTNVAMVHAKELGTKPLDLALEIKERLLSHQIRHITRVDVIEPGFINFFFDEHYFTKSLSNNEGDRGRIFEGQKFIIEHTQPNPFKEFHIGHLMNNTIGEAIVRITRKNGAEVKAATYHGDVGLHVAKAVWAMKNGNPIQEAYALGNKAYESDENAKEEILAINKKIYNGSDEEINKIYKEGRQASIDYFDSIYKRLGSQFNEHFYENVSGEAGKTLVLNNVGNVFEEGENGAVIFKGENFGLHTRVFLTKEGLPTYEAKELGLAEIKKDYYYPYDRSITITANEQDAFFKVVEVAIGEVFPDLKGKLKHLSHGLLKLPTGKMSSRTGDVITAESMIDQVKERVFEKIKEREMSDEKKEEVAEMVSLGAIKYAILRSAIGGDIIFDVEKSVSFEGDSGPYLQYAAVRARSILEKAKGVVESDGSLSPEWKTSDLERLIERFNNVITRAGEEYAPHHIVTYLTALASEFNSFYATNKITDELDATSPYKLSITSAFVRTMEEGLDLLGIKVPEKM